jgi:hypothetical protein
MGGFVLFIVLSAANTMFQVSRNYLYLYSFCSACYTSPDLPTSKKSFEQCNIIPLITASATVALRLVPRFSSRSSSR